VETKFFGTTLAIWADGDWRDYHWFQGEHREYLQSDFWKGLAQKIRMDREWRCECCGDRGWIVHHLTYARWPFRELDSDLLLTCDHCHDKLHKRASPRP